MANFIFKSADVGGDYRAGTVAKDSTIKNGPLQSGGGSKQRRLTTKRIPELKMDPSEVVGVLSKDDLPQRRFHN